VTDLPPVLVVPGAPVADDLDAEFAAHGGGVAGEGERAPPTVGRREALTAPLHGDGPEPPRALAAFRRRVAPNVAVRVEGAGGGRVVEPHSPGVARPREGRRRRARVAALLNPRADQEVRGVVLSA
jgi:hypothetical protein